MTDVAGLIQLYGLFATGKRFRRTDGTTVRTYTVRGADYLPRGDVDGPWWLEFNTITEETNRSAPAHRGANRIPMSNVLAHILIGELRPLRDNEE